MSSECRLGRFTVDSPVAESGMGLVYKTTDPSTGQTVAVKVARPGARSSRFDREIELSRKLSHRGIVSYVDHGITADGRSFLVTRWIEGEPLDAVLAGRGVTLAEAVTIGRNIGDALAAAHELGVVHRDLKPSNVIVHCDDGGVRGVVLIDFGLARSADDGALTADGTVLGTVGYMAPEQARGDGDIGPTADVFALGCLLYLCIAGQHAFAGEDEHATQAKILYHWPTPASARNKLVPRALDEAIAQFVAKEPADRPADGSAALTALSAFDGLDDGHRVVMGAPAKQWQTQALSEVLRDSEPNKAATDGVATVALVNPYERTWQPRADTAANTTLPGKSRGRYANIEEIGSGGLGRVFRARDTHLERDVAIKELLHRSPVSVARFRREALVTARLEHPGIVPVQDLGRWPDGSPFYAMKLVTGETLAELIEGCDDFDDRLALVPKVGAVCEAMAYAHDNDVIHRDLKPANVVVGEFGETVIIDWGLAKGLREDDSGGDGDPGPPDQGPYRAAHKTDELTRAGDVLGTPMFMAPEQARGDAADTRTDVYGLGAILYYLLSGRPPHQSDGKTDLNAIAERDPPALPELAAATPTELLDIVAKSMARQPGERYPSATELAADLGRFLTGQLVRAHRYTRAEIVRRFVRRHRAVLSVVAAAVIAAAVFGWFAVDKIVAAERDATRQRDAAERASAKAELEYRRLRVLQAEQALAGDPTKTLAWLKFDGEFPQDLRARAVRAATVAVSEGVARHVFRVDGSVNSMASAGDAIAVASAGGEVTVWSAASGRQLFSGRLTAAGGAISVDLADDGRRVVAASATGVTLWNGSAAREFEIAGASMVRFVSTERIAVVTEHGELVIIDEGTGERVRRKLHTGAIYQLAVRDGSIATAGHDGSIAFVRDDGQVTTWKAHNGIATHVEFVGDGELLSCGLDARVRLWSVHQQEPIAEWKADAPLFGFDHRAGRALLYGNGASMSLWSRESSGALETRKLGDVPSLARVGNGFWTAAVSSNLVVQRSSGDRVVLRGHRDQIDQIEILRHDTLASADRTGEVRVWRMPRGADLVTELAGVATPPAAVADGFVVGDANGGLWKVGATGKTRLAQLDSAITALDAHSDAIAIATADNRVAIVRDGSLEYMRGTFETRLLALSNTARFVASLSLDGRVRIWHPPSGDVVDTIDSLEGAGYLHFETDDSAIVIASPTGKQRRVSLTAIGPLAVRDHGSRTAFPMSIAVRAHDGAVAVGSRDGVIVTDAAGAVLSQHSITLVHGVEFAADGGVVAVAGDGLVHRIDSRGAHTTLRGHNKWARGIAVAGDVAASFSGVEPIAWWWRPAEHIGGPVRARGDVIGGAFSRDHLVLALSDRAGFVSLHSEPTRDAIAPAPDQPRREWLDRQTSAEIGPSKALETRPTSIRPSLP